MTASMIQHKRGTLLLAVSSVCWSFGGMLIKLVQWDAMTVVCMRCGLALIVMGLFLRKRVSFRITPGVLLSTLCLSATMILNVYANKLTTAANAIMLEYSSPIFVVILGALVFRHKPRALDIAAVAVVSVGIVFLCSGKQEGVSLLGNLLALLSGLCFSGVYLINGREDANPELASLLCMALNFIIAMPFAVHGVTADPLSWLGILLLTLITTCLAYILFSSGIRMSTPLAASLLAAIEPILNPVWVALVQHEFPGFQAVASSILVLLAVVGYNILSVRNARAAGPPSMSSECIRDIDNDI